MFLDLGCFDSAMNLCLLNMYFVDGCAMNVVVKTL